MRIVAGKYRGRRFTASNKITARPTTNFAKEALFNILQSHIDWPKVKMLDLFAGIGSITFEAISRGCEEVTAIEQNAFCVKFIQETAAKLDCELQLAVKRMDALKYIAKPTQRFDFIFADPPYDMEASNYTKLVQNLLEGELLNPEGLFVLEHSVRHNFENHERFLKQKKYGSVHFTFFK